MRSIIALVVFAVVLLAATVKADDEKEKKIGLSECPKAVQKTLKAELGKGKLVGIDVREMNGVAVYESEIWLGELEYDLVIREDGTLLTKQLENDGTDEDSAEADEDEDGDSKDADEANETGGTEVETPIRMADLPRAVRKTLKRESRGGEIEEIEMEVEGDVLVFEAEVEYETNDRELEYEIKIAADGTLLGKILEDDEEDDEDEDDEEQDEEDDEGQEDDD